MIIDITWNKRQSWICQDYKLITEVNSNINVINQTIEYIDDLVNIYRGFSTEYLAVRLTVYLLQPITPTVEIFIQFTGIVE